MSVRERPGDLGAKDARRFVSEAAKEIRVARRELGLSQVTAARRAGMSASQFGRIEQEDLAQPTLDQLSRAARAVGLAPSLRLYRDDRYVRDRGQLLVLGRFETLLAPPLRMAREVPLPIIGDKRAWDGRVSDGRRGASVECESRLDDCQAVSRRIELKSRDDPDAGPVILVVNRTAHNRDVLKVHREALRLQFPLDGFAIARVLRRGEVPPASGIILV
jgi:transcriptional regulator with XRE-family HTH domain